MMKKQYVDLLGLAAALSLLLAACGGQSSGGPALGEPSASEGASLSELQTNLPEETPIFTPGTWLSDAGQYYFFDEDGAAGRTASLENGTGVGFSYTTDGNEAVFSMGAEDNVSACSMRRAGERLTLRWADGMEETLIYVSDQGSDSFQFYSNRELAEMALTYYIAQNSAQDSGNLSAAAQTNDDGSVTIQVYENLGDHNSTADWYTVDRITGTGTDALGCEIDLIP